MRQRPRLTAQMIRDLPTPAKGSRIHYDAGHDYVHGFGVCATSSGHRSFILNYRFEGKEHRLTIGAVSSWTLAAARAEAAGIRRMIDRGENPMVDSPSLSDAPTMFDLIARFREEELSRRRPATQKSYHSIIKVISGAALGSMLVTQITSGDIKNLHRHLSGKPVMANRVTTFLYGLFRLAIEWGWREGNPAADIERNEESPRQRYLSGTELERFLAAVEGLADQQAATIFKTLLLTGCRKGEALSMRWGDLDLDSGIWARPASATRQKDKPRTPLSKATVDVLRALPRQGPFVFGGGHARTELRPAWREVCKVADLHDFHIHDLRHSFASFAVQGGASLEIIGALLGHRHPATTQRYSHLDDTSLRAVAERIGDIVGKK
jgi:integrase